MEKKKKIILVISLATLLFSALGFSAFATNSFTESEGSLIQQTIAIESIEMIGDQSENVVDMYTMPYQAFISNDFRRMNTNIAGAGAPGIRSSQAVSAKYENGTRKWITDVTFQYQEDLREYLKFNISDFVYNSRADDILRSDLAPTVAFSNSDLISVIEIEYKYTITGYNTDIEEWTTLRITRNQRVTSNTTEAQPLIYRTGIAMTVGNYGFEGDVIISDISTMFNTQRINDQGTATPLYLQNYTYTSYTDFEARNISDVLVNTNEAVNPLPEATNFWDWLVESVDSVLNIKIFYDFSIGDLLYCIMGIAIVLIFMKIFAGG